MWHTFVSIADRALERAIFGFASVFWQHPAVSAGFLAGFLVLTVLLWIETLKDTSRTEQFEELSPLRFRR